MEMLETWIVGQQPMIINSVVNFLLAIVALWIGFKVTNRLSSLLSGAMLRKSIDPTIAEFAVSLFQIFLKIAVIITVLSYVGFETSSFIAVLGAAGLAIGLSLQGSLANFASGILIIMFRPFKAGDFVEAGGVAGSVKEIQIFSTILTSPDNKYIVVPNAQVTGSPIINYSRHDTRRIDLIIGVSYTADLQKSEQVLTSILENHPLVLKDPAHTIGVIALGDSAVNFAVRPWVKTSDYWPVQFELNKQIKEALDKENIGIPYPQMDVHVHQTNQ
jgi:small conductance mechanosensitive channel